MPLMRRLWLCWAAAAATPVVPVVDVFSRGEAGYYCIKIPSLTALPDGGLLALGEARVGSCSDFTETHLVMKKSKDGGKSWSAVSVVAQKPNVVVGNAAPVVVGDTDIVLVFNENNQRVFVTRSKDLGDTWSEAVDISQNATLPSWKWVGTGPPAGLRLSTGRLIIPSYHTRILPYRIGDGEDSHGHMLLSDDDGRTWRLSADQNFGFPHWPNENQVVELPGGRVAAFARSLSVRRLRTESPDGGEHWGASEVLETLPETIMQGCQGSTVSCPSAASGLVYSGPIGTGKYREKMSIMVSSDEGHTWSLHKVVDPGCSAYSSLAWQGGKLGLLYERSENFTVVFLPDHISFTTLVDPCGETPPEVVV